MMFSFGSGPPIGPCGPKAAAFEPRLSWVLRSSASTLGIQTVVTLELEVQPARSLLRMGNYKRSVK
jgi:hypothetical protein